MEEEPERKREDRFQEDRELRIWGGGGPAQEEREPKYIMEDGGPEQRGKGG